METLQTIFTGFSVIISIATLFVAIGIGNRQNEINEQALKINDFAEIFLVPQNLTDATGKVIIAHNLLIKNASAYPIYLNSYELSGYSKVDIGGSSIPNNPDSWYIVPIPKNIEVNGVFSIKILFEDYRGKKYQVEGNGKKENGGWNINSKKRVEIN